MARAPDPRIEQAKAMYLQGAKLVKIASQLNLPEGTVRRWKCTHKWDNERSDKKSERSNRKKGGQPGNKNATGPPKNTEELRNKIKMQKNSVSSASICLRRPFLLSRRCRRIRWMSSGIRSRLRMLLLSGHSRSCMCVTGMIRQSKRLSIRTAT